jgi:hypothetical protein
VAEISLIAAGLHRSVALTGIRQLHDCRADCNGLGGLDCAKVIAGAAAAF